MMKQTRRSILKWAAGVVAGSVLARLPLSGYVQEESKTERFKDWLRSGSIVWLGSAADNKWLNPDNWNLGRIPRDGDDVIIGGRIEDGSSIPLGDIVLNSITLLPGAELTLDRSDCAREFIAG